MKTQQHGFAHAFLIIGLIVALIGALGFVFWQNFIYKEPKLSQETTVHKSTSSASKNTSENPDEGYLVLKEWGVKFKLAKNSGEVHSYKEHVSNENGSFEYYQLSTKRVEELGGQCAPDASEGPIRLSSISRTEIKQDAGQLASATPANNNEPINGYYYYVSGGQSSCADEHTDWQAADNRMTYDLLMQPVGV